jgi:hypothetical protein
MFGKTSEGISFAISGVQSKTVMLAKALISQQISAFNFRNF